MKRSLVWFKSDLRLMDNETLLKAIQNSDEIIPFFCLDERLMREGQFGFRRIGVYRLKFLLESVADLDQQLRKKGSGLYFCFGIPELIIPQIVLELDVSHVYTSNEIAYEEKNILKTVEKELRKQSCSFNIFNTSTLYHPLDLPFETHDVPEVFSAFRKQIEKKSFIRSSLKTPDTIKSPSIAPIHLPSMQKLGYSQTNKDIRKVLNFEGGELKGQERLEYYFFKSKALSEYKKTRNNLIGANYSSKLSPWLANGCISAKWVYYQVKEYEKVNGANDSTYWLIFELIWRDFFKFIMIKHKTSLFQLYGINRAKLVSDNNDSSELRKWINGNTGDDFVDANMRELKYTGFMSNRGRQNVASYLVHQLKLDWRIGAAYFEQQLIDYDVCSNWGNWAYLAGVGNDPRVTRVFNTEKQARVYDPEGNFRRLWLD